MQDWREALTPIDDSLSVSLGAIGEVYRRGLKTLRAADAARRIWDRNGSLWAMDQPQVIREIERRLGWLDLPETMPREIPSLRAFVDEIRADGLTRAMLLGMGGSSLAAETMRLILGVAPGYLDLDVLDTTDPAQIRRVAARAPLEQTLFIVASKSGNTAETVNQYHYFREAVRQAVGDRWPRRFCVITDPVTTLAALAREENLRALFLNPPDIGGRYSALSFFGLVPAALIGADLDLLLDRARQLARTCRPDILIERNPGVVWGAIMGELATRTLPHRDKLTLLSSPELAAFGPWAEQLIAESTGKEDVGILPVEGEPPRPVGEYGLDRLFAYLRLDGGQNDETDSQVGELVQAGFPVALIRLRDLYDLGSEFFRWEFAIAVAGQRLGINPFDQPNVEAAKQRAREALDRYTRTQRLPQETPILSHGGLTIYGQTIGIVELSVYLKHLLTQVQEHDYLAIMAWVDRNEANTELLQMLRAVLGRKLGVATTLGFGPRFLHSTGQLHKGGSNNGLFLQITQQETEDLPIPGQPYTFGILKLAQALGDLQALRERDRRVIRIDVGGDVSRGLRELIQLIEQDL